MQNLTKELKSRLKGYGKIAVLGIGSELRADDAAGTLVARDICKSSKRPARLKAFFGETAPENLTGEIRSYKPAHIIIVDTADIKQKPGTVLLLDQKNLGAGVSFSTHKLPAKILMDYFTRSLRCGVIFIGIQPKSLKFGKDVSKEVKGSVKGISSAIMEAAKGKA